jgi:hypothetical protein
MSSRDEDYVFQLFQRKVLVCSDECADSAQIIRIGHLLNGAHLSLQHRLATVPQNQPMVVRGKTGQRGWRDFVVFGFFDSYGGKSVFMPDCAAAF